MGPRSFVPILQRDQESRLYTMNGPFQCSKSDGLLGVLEAWMKSCDTAVVCLLGLMDAREVEQTKPKPSQSLGVKESGVKVSH